MWLQVVNVCYSLKCFEMFEAKGKSEAEGLPDRTTSLSLSHRFEVSLKNVDKVSLFLFLITMKQK